MANKRKDFNVVDAVSVSLALSELYGFRKVNEDTPTKELCSKVLDPKGLSEEKFALRIWNEIESSDYIGENELKLIKENLNSKKNISGWANNVLLTLEKEACTTKDLGIIASSVVASPTLNSITKSSVRVPKNTELIDVTGIVKSSGYAMTDVNGSVYYNINLSVPQLRIQSIIVESFTTIETGDLNYGDIIKFDGRFSPPGGFSDIISVNEFYKADDYTYSNEFVKHLFLDPPF